EPTFPALTGRVVDDADLLSPADEQELTDELKALEDKSSDQLVVVTLPSLQGYPIEDYGYRLGRNWGIGTAKLNNGVLLIVAPNEHRVRIEVGYGLEGTLTDALSKIIIENAILPKFRAGDYAGGIKDGVSDIIKVLTGDAAEVDWVMIIFWILMLSWIAYSVYRNARYASVADKTRRGRGWTGPVFMPGPSWDSGSSGGGWNSGGGGGG